METVEIVETVETVVIVETVERTLHFSTLLLQETPGQRENCLLSVYDIAQCTIAHSFSVLGCICLHIVLHYSANATYIDIYIFSANR